MAQTNSKFFSVMVVGENPKEIMDKYGADLKVAPYIKYRYLDAKKYQTTAIKALSKLLEDADKIGIAPNIKEALELRLDSLNRMSSFEYYQELTNGMYYDENGNALSEKNPNAKWNTCRIGRNFSLPLILKDSSETYSARAKDVNWEAMNMANSSTYNSAWEVVVEGREPNDDLERAIYESMKDKTTYFSNFKSKEDYVTYSTAYWNYAYVDEDNGWLDADNVCNGDETAWINGFYEKFISNLNPNSLVTIFECSINNG